MCSCGCDCGECFGGIWLEGVCEGGEFVDHFILHASMASRPSKGMGQVAYVMMCSEVELLVLYAPAGDFPTKVSMRVHTITVLHKVIRIWPPSLSAVGSNRGASAYGHKQFHGQLQPVEGGSMAPEVSVRIEVSNLPCTVCTQRTSVNCLQACLEREGLMKFGDQIG